jgi:hypothetical protein
LCRAIKNRAQVIVPNCPLPVAVAFGPGIWNLCNVSGGPLN